VKRITELGLELDREGGVVEASNYSQP
jgi:hypothetical protein